MEVSRGTWTQTLQEFRSNAISRDNKRIVTIVIILIFIIIIIIITEL
jgi:hypothetical protein